MGVLGKGRWENGGVGSGGWEVVRLVFCVWISCGCRGCSRTLTDMLPLRKGS